jgi:hypothetical protein
LPAVGAPPSKKFSAPEILNDGTESTSSGRIGKALTVCSRHRIVENYVSGKIVDLKTIAPDRYWLNDEPDTGRIPKGNVIFADSELKGSPECQLPK